MIVDSLKNKEIYESVHPKFGEAFAFIERVVAEGLAVGRYELDGDALFALVQEYPTKAPADCPFEAHRKYIDIQYVKSGRERMGVADLAHVTTSAEYNPERDVEFFNTPEDASILTVGADEFAVFFPHDAHQPAMAMGESETVEKIVVKVRV
jgi:YhcH/YjgK/YiaL family protein